MSKMGELLIELEEDFERLSSTSMNWNQDLWEDQVNDGRFSILPNDWQFGYIHWFENYASVVAAKGILREIGEDFAVKADDSNGEWAILTNYESNVWKG